MSHHVGSFLTRVKCSGVKDEINRYLSAEWRDRPPRYLTKQRRMLLRFVTLVSYRVVFVRIHVVGNLRINRNPVWERR
jgi:hypothetical protein